MTATSTLRTWWAPACKGPFTTVSLYGAGRVTVRSNIVSAVHALNACLVVHRYPTRQADTGAYNCRPITGGTAYSLHAYGIAVDLNWQSNPYGPNLITDMPPAMVAAIKAIRTKNGKQVWRWGGDYRGNKDAMHFEVVCSPADIATGIDPRSLPGPTEEEFHLSTEQYNNIMNKLREIDSEETKRFAHTDQLLRGIAASISELATAVRNREYSTRDSMIAAFRRILGVKLDSNNTVQQQHDAETGKKFQNHLNS